MLHFGVIFGARFANRCDYVDFLVIFFRSRKNERKRSSQGGDMRSAHAGAGFVRVGRCRFGTVLGSILESFWEPRAPLYSFLVARVAKKRVTKGRVTKKRKTGEILGAGRGGEQPIALDV